MLCEGGAEIQGLHLTKRHCAVFDDEIDRITQKIGPRKKAFQLTESNEIATTFQPLEDKTSESGKYPLPTFMQTQPHIITPKRKVFISYHHRNDQAYKQALLEFNNAHGIFIDASVDIGDIDDSLSSQAIRRKIRDEYLANSTVTILLVGTETKYRKHIDWELYSSMIDGSVNRRSGILVINLPSTNCTTFTAAHPGEKEFVHPDCTSWTNVKTITEYEQRYQYMPDRIIDNLLEPNAKISVIPWEKLDVKRLTFLVEAAFQGRESCQYDMSREMRRSDYNPFI